MYLHPKSPETVSLRVDCRHLQRPGLHLAALRFEVGKRCSRPFRRDQLHRGRCRPCEYPCAVVFWDALQDILQAQATYAATGEWRGAFKPLPMEKAPENWIAQWERVGHLQRREAALNMDKKTVMYDALSGIRAA